MPHFLVNPQCFKMSGDTCNESLSVSVFLFLGVPAIITIFKQYFPLHTAPEASHLTSGFQSECLC